MKEYLYWYSVGKPKHEKIMITTNEQDVYIGDVIVRNHNDNVNYSYQEKYKGVLKLTYPIEHGIIVDWPNMEILWRHVFDELKVSPKEHPVLLTEAPLNPYNNRIRAADVFFETFQTPSLFFQTQAVLSLYAQGKTSGVVIDCGDGVCHVSPVYEGFSINSAIQRIDLGGRDVTTHLMNLLRRAGYIFHTTAEFEIVKKIKEKYCYVAPMNSSNDEYLKVQDDRSQTSYLLPDGNQMKISTEKYLAPEILFSPDKIGLEYPGVHEMVVNAIKKCDIDLRKTLYNNIIAAGGSTLFMGFSDRLHKSIQKLAPKDMKVTLIAPNNRKQSCWIGGATVSSLKAFSRMWVTKKEYEEEGYRVLLRQSV